MKYFIVFVNFLLIICLLSISYAKKKEEEEEVIVDPAVVLEKYKKTKFDWKNPMTIFWHWGLDPICAYVPPTIKVICMYVKKGLKNKIGMREISEKEGFSRGCYQFKVEGTGRTQRVSRCPLAINESSHIFISYGYDVSNSYYVYKSSTLPAKKNKIRKDKEATPAKLIALVPIGKIVWFLSKPPKKED